MFGSFNTSSFNKIRLNASSLIVAAATNVILYTSISIVNVGVSANISNYIPITSAMDVMYSPALPVDNCYIQTSVAITSSVVVRVEENRIQRSLFLGMV